MGEKRFWTAFDAGFSKIGLTMTTTQQYQLERFPLTLATSNGGQTSDESLNELSTAVKWQIVHQSSRYQPHASLCPVASVFGGLCGVIAHSLFNELCSTEVTNAAIHSADSATRDVHALPTLAGWLQQLIAKNGTRKHKVGCQRQFSVAIGNVATVNFTR